MAGLVAGASAGVGEGLAGDGNKLPIVAVRAKSEFQNPEGARLMRFAVWFESAEGTKVIAACADDKFTNAMRWIGNAVGSLRSEALVIVVVTVEDDGAVGIV